MELLYSEEQLNRPKGSSKSNQEPRVNKKIRATGFEGEALGDSRTSNWDRYCRVPGRRNGGHGWRAGAELKQQEPLADERSEVEMHSYRNLAGRGLFSLLEVALIASVLAVVATIVGPRISHAAAPAASHDEQLLEGRLRMLRGAIEEYWFDHGGQFPSGNAVRITEQLTTYTDFDGNPSRRPDRQHSLGPYLREIPLLPVGENRGQSRLSLQFEDGAGWVYQPATGRIRANTATWEVDSNFR